MTRPGRAVESFLSVTGNARLLTRAAFEGQDDPSGLWGPLSGKKQLTWSSPRPLDEVKYAGRRTGATVNDLGLAAIAGALRTYLLDRGQDVWQFTAVVPVNLRPLDQPMDPQQGNQFGLAFVRLPVAEPEREARLAKVREAMDRVKGTHEPVIIYSVLGAMAQTPSQVEQAWLDLFARRASSVVTNIAGPREPVALAGVALSGFAAWVPCTGPIGVGLSVCSYAGELVLGVAVDRAQVPDSTALLTDLTDEFEAMLAGESALVGRGTTARPARRPARASK